jgi:hypothetical protein
MVGKPAALLRPRTRTAALISTLSGIGCTANKKGETVPVAIEMNFKGATLEQYDKIVELMGLTSGNIPQGALFHWAAKTDDGIRVVDVWESREVFDRFSQEQIGPLSQQAGVTEPPETTYRDVHNHLPHS